MRRRRPDWLSTCCYHVSNTCYEGVKIFRFAYMRDQAMKRLRQMKDKHPVRILDFLLHPYGYRLLLDADHPGHISEAIRFFNGITVQDWQKRKKKQGPAWRSRYNLTLVQKGEQAVRCALDMDFAMARSGDPDLFHPLLWKHSGHYDLTGVRKRYRCVDFQAVQKCFADAPKDNFHQWYIQAANNKFDSGEYAAESWWEEALAVGDRQLCEKIAHTLPSSSFKLCAYPAPETIPDLEQAISYTIITAKQRKREYILSYAR